MALESRVWENHPARFGGREAQAFPTPIELRPLVFNDESSAWEPAKGFGMYNITPMAFSKASLKRRESLEHYCSYRAKH